MLPCPPPEAGDVGLMNDLLKDLEDPETLKEVEKLMKVRAGTRIAGGGPKVRSSGFQTLPFICRDMYMM